MTRSQFSSHWNQNNVSNLAQVLKCFLKEKNTYKISINLRNTTVILTVYSKHATYRKQWIGHLRGKKSNQYIIEKVAVINCIISG